MFKNIKYDKLSMPERAKLISKYHVNGDWSMNRLAAELGTYVNKIKRDAAKLGIQTNSLSEAQKKALATGIAKHPTKGTKRPQETLDKMSKNIRAAFLSWDEKKRKADSIKKAKLLKKQKNKPYLSHKKTEGIQAAAKIGSKLERHLYNILSQHYRVEFHKTDNVDAHNFHIDLFLPKQRIAIEIDGPAHYEDIWGKEKLEKNKEKDKRKDGLILQKGYVLIRFINDKKFSKAYGDDAANLLMSHINIIIMKKNKEKLITCQLKR